MNKPPKKPPPKKPPPKKPPPKDYKFDPSEPPLMKNVGRDVRAIPAASLIQEVGTATWTTQIFGRGLVSDVALIRGFEPKPIHYEINNTFVLRRTLHWTISQPIIHLAEPKTLKVTTKTGYDLTQQRSMQRSLGVEVGGKVGFAGLGLSASVKETLVISDSTTERWSEEISEETSQIFQASTTYVTWSLIDSLQLHKTSVQQYFWDEGRTPIGNPTTTEGDDVIDCAITVWQDKLTDK